MKRLPLANRLGTHLLTNKRSKVLSKIIRHRNSFWFSLISVVPKEVDASGEQKWKVVTDYRKLNEKTIDEKYPLPNIYDILDKLRKCQYYTILDLASNWFSSSQKG